MVQVAKRGASVLKRRKSRNRMDSSSTNNNNNNSGNQTASNNDGQSTSHMPTRSESDGDVVFYTEEPRAGEFKWQQPEVHNIDSAIITI